MSDAGSPAGAGEAPIGDQGAAVSQAKAHQSGGGGQHLPHTGTALGALIADDNDVSLLNVPPTDGQDGVHLPIEDSSRAPVDPHFLVHCRALQPRADGRQTPFQHNQPALGSNRVTGVVDDLLV